MGTPDLFDAAIVKQEIENSFPNEDDQVLGITYCDVSPKKEDNALMFPPSISTKLEPDFHFLQLDLTNCKCEGAEFSPPFYHNESFEAQTSNIRSELETGSAYQHKVGSSTELSRSSNNKNAAYSNKRGYTHSFSAIRQQTCKEKVGVILS
ncbi:uncharacterized protein LOC136027405 isoform X1 [Artemia franciscana]|uniref:uncharacterized protein LOC136027405 isoform X1 n=1 Tax=Artemia franciscana TaxID=6661 RepID=UPI0032D9FD9F